MKANEKVRLGYYGLVAIVAIFNMKLAILLLFIVEIAMITVLTLVGLSYFARILKHRFNVFRFNRKTFNAESTKVTALLCR